MWSTKKINGTLYPLLPIDGSNSRPELSDLEFFRKSLICDVRENATILEYEGLEKETPVERPRPAPKPTSVEEIANATDIEQLALMHFASSGRVSRRKFNSEVNVLNLMIEGCRYCGRIGREHKSNHIYVSCRLRSGQMVQKCTDFDCKSWESPPVEIPESMLERLRREYAPNEVYVSQKPKAYGMQNLQGDELIAAIEKDLEKPTEERIDLD
jgi:hypothetical protein